MEILREALKQLISLARNEGLIQGNAGVPKDNNKSARAFANIEGSPIQLTYFIIVFNEIKSFFSTWTFK